MRKLMWLLPAMALGAPAVQAQFGRPYDPRPGGSYLRGPDVPGVDARRNPFGLRTPAVPDMPGAYDPFARFRPPVSQVGRPLWMPPTLLDILNQHGIEKSILGRHFDPFSHFDPLDPQSIIYGPRNGLDRNLPIPGVRIDPMIPSANLPPVQSFELVPKVFEPPKPFSSLKNLEAKTDARPAGGRTPEWLCWEYAAGVFILAMVAGLLHALTRNKIFESKIDE